MNTHSRLISHAALFVLFVTPAAAFAQRPAADEAKMGIVMSAPASLSMIFQVSPRLAVRPELGFSTGTSNSNATPPTTGTSWTLTPAVSGLFYTGKWDSLRSYFAGRYAYTHQKSTSNGVVAGVSSSNTNSLSGSFGADYALHRHFAAFAEVGISFAHASSSTAAITNVPTSNNWSTRSAVGGIFYF